MATFHDSAKGSNNASGTDQATTDALAVTAGDLIVIAGKWEGANGAVASFGGDGNTYGAATAVQNHTNNDLHHTIHWAIAASSGSINPNFHLDAARTFRYTAAMSFTPAAGKTWQLGQTSQGGNGNTSTTPSSGSISSTGQGVVVGFGSLYGSRTLTAGSGFTVPAELATDLLVAEYQLFGAGGGTFNADGTFESSVEWLMHGAIFEEINEGPPPPAPRIVTPVQSIRF